MQSLLSCCTACNTIKLLNLLHLWPACYYFVQAKGKAAASASAVEGSSKQDKEDAKAKKAPKTAASKQDDLQNPPLTAVPKQVSASDICRNDCISNISKP